MLSFRLISVTIAVACCTILSVQGQFGGFFRPFFGRRPSRPAPRPQPSFNRPAPRPQQQFRGGSCPTSGPNHSFGGQNFVISWLNGNKATCGQFTGSGAQAYCRSMGMNAINLDNNAKADHFIGLLRADRGQTYFWTGGNVDHRGGRVNWGNGSSQNIRDIRYWSRTGGRGQPQPDNREGRETCLGVLKNVYQDGTVFHDISCHHKKPVICEA